MYAYSPSYQAFPNDLYGYAQDTAGYSTYNQPYESYAPDYSDYYSYSTPTYEHRAPRHSQPRRSHSQYPAQYPQRAKPIDTALDRSVRAQAAIHQRLGNSVADNSWAGRRHNRKVYKAMGTPEKLATIGDMEEALAANDQLFDALQAESSGSRLERWAIGIGRHANNKVMKELQREKRRETKRMVKQGFY
eukprot:TRINITY_DN34818_c0_g1_i1.p1 TRINITY_DN34818_c0_g1~~TRINITY_DN34818_c0_g1_i1.p1  ORF type:complete len:217 (-),score=10.57 TRINITY_DN34818_c0_g1_i1:111-680(-)